VGITTSAVSGSSIIISDDGNILTNFHMVEDASHISVSMYNGEGNDIAVLKIDAEGLAPVDKVSKNVMFSDALPFLDFGSPISTE